MKMTVARVRPCPPEGKGVHQWLFATACQMARSGARADETTAFLETHAARHDLREIEDAVRNAFDTVRAGNRSPSTSNRYRPVARIQPWPKADFDRIERIDRSGYGLVDLWEESPLRIDPETPPREVLALLFAPDDLLTAAVVREGARTYTLAEWGDSLNRCRFLVPNAAAVRSGLTRDGRTSQRALSMFPRRHYLVIEFDQASLDQQACRIRYLAAKAPLAMVVFSGSKSLHAWFRCIDPDDDRLRPFFAEACHLGADPATWQRHQLVRLPEGLREGSQNRQSIFYFNPPKA